MPYMCNIIWYLSFSLSDISFGMRISRSTHVASNGISLFFLMTEWYSTVCMYHVSFIHSSVNGHLGAFHFLALVNSAAVNIEVHVSFQIMVFSGFMPRSSIAGSYGSSILSFWGTSMLFSTVYKGSFSFTPSPLFTVYEFADDGHFDWCELIPHLNFDLHMNCLWSSLLARMENNKFIQSGAIPRAPVILL